MKWNNKQEMKKEIGGFLELEKPLGKEYYSNCISLNSASNALIYYLKAENINKIYIPYYLCNSISQKLDSYNFDYEYYHIGKSFLPVFEKDLSNKEALYIVNFYGQISNRIISKLKKRYKRIIIDNVQSFFQKPLDNVCTVYSCRKFFGVPDGAYLFYQNHELLNLKRDNSCRGFIHLAGRKDTDANRYYELFLENERENAKKPPMFMSESTKILLSNIDYSFVKKKRKENYSVLEDRLTNINKLSLKNINIPMCYPLLVDNGSVIRKKMIKHKIYIPLLWDNINKGASEIEKEYANNILPIPCDQRYSVNDMNYVLSIIEKEGVGLK